MIRSKQGPPGSYKLVCDATVSDTRSDLHCVRLNTQTGEMIVVTLPRLRKIPTPADPRR